MAIHKISKLIICLALTLGSVAAPVLAGDSHGGAYLGVMVAKVSPETAAALHLQNASGAAIENVDQDGPACSAGLKGGDIVVAFNGKPVSGPDQFASMIHSSAPGSTVTMTVIRNGNSQDMKVKLGDWKQMAGMPKVPLNPVGNMPFPGAPPEPPLPPMRYPGMDIPAGNSISARDGIVVEPLSPQLCDFFGVPQNKGVLVRSVETGSPGAAAGVKAGDVIVRVNNETIHDMADWKRAMKSQGGKLTLGIVRDKREQTVQMTVPANTSELQNGDWNSFEQNMQAMAAEMQKFGPEFERNAQELATLAQLDQRQIDKINRQANSAVKTVTPEMKKQAQEMRKQAEQMRKEVAKMTPEMARTAREMADSMKPTAKEWADMARDMDKQWKDMQPEFEQQMQEFKKEMEQEKREWQEIFKGSGSKQQL